MKRSGEGGVGLDVGGGWKLGEKVGKDFYIYSLHVVGGDSISVNWPPALTSFIRHRHHYHHHLSPSPS